ncbi:MAG: hypothetical protein J6V04_02260 [Bacteroidales bacterium]|nr:hypothetical protein [Bacteroidales bacterium]
MKKILLLTSILLLGAMTLSCSKATGEKDPSNPGGENTNLIVSHHLDGIYYGDEFAPNVGNYWVHLSNNGFNNDEYLPNTYYYRLDLYGPILENTQTLTIPDGIYTFDKNNTYNEYTISQEFSCLIETDNEGNQFETPFENGQFIVNGTELNLYVTIGGIDYQIKFNGEYTLEDGRDNPNPPASGDSYSTLTDDHQVNFVSANARLDYAGDWWQCGFDNFTLYIMSKENGILNGDTILLDFITQYSNNTGGIAGNYVGSDNAAPMVYMYGTVQYNIPVGCWYFKYQNESIIAQAPITSGSLSITYNDNGSCTIELDAYDDAQTPNRITAQWTGEITETFAASAQSKGNFVEINQNSHPFRKR